MSRDEHHAVEHASLQSVAPASHPDKATSLVDLFSALARQHPTDTIFRHKAGGAWRDIAWQDFIDRARLSGLAARGAGLARGDVGCILAATGYDWMCADAGMLGIGMVSAGIYPTEPPAKIAYLVNDCKARVLFVDTPEQLQKALAVRADCPSLETIVVFDPAFTENPAELAIRSYASWLEAGRAQDRVAPGLWEREVAATRPDELAILIYTSGTTGPPKGAMISHGSAVYQVLHSTPYFFPERGWTRPAFLPLCHVAERYYTFFALQGGAVSYFVPDPSLLGATVQDFQPNFILAVPRIYEKLYEGARAWLERQPAAWHQRFSAALENGHRVADALLNGVEPDAEIRARHIADLAGPLGELRQAVGLGSARLLVAGGAPFPPTLLRWYLAMGIPLLEMYGMTETGTIATNRADNIRLRSVGRPCSLGEVRLSERGEILVRGPSLFSGYLNQPEKTAEALVDGWFQTGDLGTIEADGHLRLVGRLKDLIITSGGKNISPSEIEAKLRASPYIADAAAIGDGQKFIAALVMIDRPAVQAFGAQRGLTWDDYAALVALPEVIELIGAEIAAANTALSRVEQVKQFRIIPRELTPVDDEMTPTMKIKRPVLCQKWRHLIDEIYTPQGEAC